MARVRNQTPEQYAREAGETLTVIGTRYGVSDSQVSAVARGLVWKHVG